MRHGARAAPPWPLYRPRRLQYTGGACFHFAIALQAALGDGWRACAAGAPKERPEGDDLSHAGVMCWKGRWAGFVVDAEGAHEHQAAFMASCGPPLPGDVFHASVPFGLLVDAAAFSAAAVGGEVPEWGELIMDARRVARHLRGLPAPAGRKTEETGQGG